MEQQRDKKHRSRHHRSNYQGNNNQHLLKHEHENLNDAAVRPLTGSLTVMTSSCDDNTTSTRDGLSISLPKRHPEKMDDDDVHCYLAPSSLLRGRLLAMTSPAPSYRSNETCNDSSSKNHSSTVANVAPSTAKSFLKASSSKNFRDYKSNDNPEPLRKKCTSSELPRPVPRPFREEARTDSWSSTFMEDLGEESVPPKLEDGGEIRSPIYLRVYDISHGMSAKWSRFVVGTSIPGVWHSGIRVFGSEYFYGGGIFKLASERVEEHLKTKPSRVIACGLTTCTRETFESYLHAIAPAFTRQSYHIIFWNCNHFADYALRFLTNAEKRLPEFVNGIADLLKQSLSGRLILQFIGGGESPSLSHPSHTLPFPCPPPRAKHRRPAASVAPRSSARSSSSASYHYNGRGGQGLRTKSRSNALKCVSSSGDLFTSRETISECTALRPASYTWQLSVDQGAIKVLSTDEVFLGGSSMVQPRQFVQRSNSNLVVHKR